MSTDPQTTTHPRRSPLVLAGAICGIGSAVVLVVNAAKRAGLIPASPATQLVAPAAELLAIIFVTALLATVASRRGRWRLATYIVNMFALGLLAAIEVVINLVFRYLTPAEIAHLRAGPLSIVLTAGSVLFLLASVMLCAYLLPSSIGRIGPTLYLLGAIPVSLRAFVPEPVLDLGLLTLAVGIGWLAIWLLRGDPASAEAYVVSSAVHDA